MHMPTAVAAVAVAIPRLNFVFVFAHLRQRHSGDARLLGVLLAQFLEQRWRLVQKLAPDGRLECNQRVGAHSAQPQQRPHVEASGDADEQRFQGRISEQRCEDIDIYYFFGGGFGQIRWRWRWRL